MDKGIEELAGKTRDELLKLGAKTTNLYDYLSVNISGEYKILKLNERNNRYYPTNASPSLTVQEKSILLHKL